MFYYVIFLLPLIFGILNRGRGDDHPKLKTVSISFISTFAMSLLIGYFTHLSVGDAATHLIWYVLGAFVLYSLGETWGWAKWQGGLLTYYYARDIFKYEPVEYTAKRLVANKDNTLGIHTLTTWLGFKQEKDPVKYCMMALAIRGLYWWLPVGIAMYALGVMSTVMFIIFLLVMAVGFPLSNDIAARLDLPYKASKNPTSKSDTWWAQSEIIYGIIQGLMLMVVFM